MKVDCISDLHGEYPVLEGGDLLIVAGDLTSNDSEKAWCEFENWIFGQNYKEKVIIGGNHDNFLSTQNEHNFWRYWDKINVTYLCDSGIELEGLKIWGSPWTPWFKQVNSHATNFMKPDIDLDQYWDLIPDDTDILITHTPAYGILDGVEQFDGTLFHCGSQTLFNTLRKRVRPKLHIFGHIHEGYGVEKLMPRHDGTMMQSINCSYVNGLYEPVNKLIRVEL